MSSILSCTGNRHDKRNNGIFATWISHILWHHKFILRITLNLLGVNVHLLIKLKFLNVKAKYFGCHFLKNCTSRILFLYLLSFPILKLDGWIAFLTQKNLTQCNGRKAQKPPPEVFVLFLGSTDLVWADRPGATCTRKGKLNIGRFIQTKSQTFVYLHYMIIF